MLSSRKKWLDVLKGIGALFVLFGHLIPYDSRLKAYIYSFHMPLFFFVSGYLFKYEKNISKFIYKKSKRLILPYIFYSILSFNASYFLENIYMSKREVLKNILFIKGYNSFNTSLWFLIVMFWVLVTFELLLKVKEKYNIKLNIYKKVILTITLIATNILLLHFNCNLIFGLEVVPHALLIFVIGYLCKDAKYNFELNSKKNYLLFILIFISGLVLSQINNKITMSMNEYNNYILYLITALLNISAYVIISKKITKNKVLEKLSELSLLMFCTQRILFKFFNVIQSRIGVKLIESENIFVNISMTTLIIIVYLIYDKVKGVIIMRKKKLALLTIIFITFFCINSNVYARETGWEEKGGKYYYYDQKSDSYLTGWQTIDGLKYYFDENTKERLQGIHEVEGQKYFFGVTKGKVMYGWIDYDGKRYYTDPTTGVLSSGPTKVGNEYYFFGIRTNRLMYGDITDYEGEKYHTDKDGKLQSGMIELNGKWYYFDKNNNFKAASGELKLEDGEYYFNPITKERCSNVTKVNNKYYFYGIKYGKKQFGLIYYDNEYYYANPQTGELSAGWTTIDGNLYYYLPDSKKRAKGITEIDGKYYFLGIKYGLVQKGWIYYDGLTYYADPQTGELYTGWHTIGENRYFFGLKTKKVMKGWFTDPDTNELYFLDYDNGVPANGFREINSYIYYFENGKYVTGKKTIDEKQYYFYKDGKMKSNFVTIDGKTYYYYEDGSKAIGWTVIGQTKYYFNPTGVQLGANVNKIIDVSRFNGNIDWEKLKREDNVDGVIIRINDPRYDLGNEDPKLKDNITEIKRLNIPYGLYLYSYGSSYQDGVDYANESIRIIKKYTMNPTLGVFLDIEGNSINNKYSTSQFESSVRGFIETLDKNGYKSLGQVYTYKYYAENNLNSEYIHNNLTWIAQYNNTGCTYNGTYKMWQYTSTGVVKGIIGDVDISILFK